MSLSPSQSIATASGDVEKGQFSQPQFGQSQPERFLFDPDQALKVQQVAPDVLPWAQPAPMGLIAFAVPTMLFSFLNFGWGEASFVYFVFWMGLSLGGLGQLIAAGFELYSNNLIAFTGFSTYGLFYLAVSGLYIMSFANPTMLAAISPAFAKYSQLMVFLIFACIALVLAVAGFLARNPFSVVIIGIYGNAFFIFVLGAAAPWSHGCAIASGVFGVLCAMSGFLGAGYIVLKTAYAAGKAGHAH